MHFFLHPFLHSCVDSFIYICTYLHTHLYMYIFMFHVPPLVFTFHCAATSPNPESNRAKASKTGRGGQAHNTPCTFWPRRPSWPSMSERCAQETSTTYALFTQRSVQRYPPRRRGGAMHPRWQRARLRHVVRLLAFVGLDRPLATEHLFGPRSRGESRTKRGTLRPGRAMPPIPRATSLVDAWVLEPSQEET